MKETLSLLTQHLDFVFIDEMSSISLPSSIPCKHFSSNDLSALMQQIVTLQHQEQKILVVTDFEPIAEVMHALNRTCSDNRIAVCCKGCWYLEAIMPEHYIGTLAEYTIPTPEEQFALAIQIASIRKADVVFSPEDILIFENNLYLINNCNGTSPFTLSTLLYFIFFGTNLHTCHDWTEAILHDLTNSPYQYPSYFLDDLERMVQGESLSAAKWLNTMERICLEQRGNQLLPLKDGVQKIALSPLIEVGEDDIETLINNIGGIPL